MKKYIIICLFICFSISNAQNQEVQKTIENFFNAFHAKDSIKLKSICSQKMILQSIVEGKNGAKLTEEKISEFYKSMVSIASNTSFKEKILSYNIQIYGSMALVWTPYEFYYNAKLSHKGVNLFTLFKETDVWKIIYIIDTRRR